MTQAPPPPALDWFLFLDVDGTLVELTDTPSQTAADPEIKSLLRDVAERLGGAVALVSGRKIETLDELFAPLKLPAAGLHGVERRKAGGAVQGASFVDAQLDGARASIKALVEAHPGTLFEDKERTIAVHFRMAPQLEEIMRRAIIDIAKPLGTNYHIQGGKMLFAADDGSNGEELWRSDGTPTGTALVKDITQNCRDTDKACAALVKDLKQRGMLDNTLVVWGGEFGRTPMMQGGDDGQGRCSWFGE